MQWLNINMNSIKNIYIYNIKIYLSLNNSISTLALSRGIHKIKPVLLIWKLLGKRIAQPLDSVFAVQHGEKNNKKKQLHFEKDHSRTQNTSLKNLTDWSSFTDTEQLLQQLRPIKAPQVGSPFEIKRFDLVKMLVPVQSGTPLPLGIRASRNTTRLHTRLQLNTLQPVD